MTLRSYQSDALESFSQPVLPTLGSHGPTVLSPAVAQLVERRAEDPSVAGSIPARGTVIADEAHRLLKRKL